jgi:hypothetical protein
VYTKNSAGSTGTLIPLDLNVNASRYKIVFETNSGKVSVENTRDAQLENLSTGVLAFNVSKKESESIIGSKNRTIYLTSVGQDGRETFMYSGEWRRPNEQSDVDAAINAIIAESTREQNLQSILDKINAEKASLTSQSEKDAANLVSPIRDKGLAPTVNRFGIKGGKSIQATGKNMVSGNTTANSNATKKQTTHTVAKDETIKTISIKYGVSIDSIKNANSLTTNSVTVGQKLIIVF